MIMMSLIKKKKNTHLIVSGIKDCGKSSATLISTKSSSRSSRPCTTTSKTQRYQSSLKVSLVLLSDQTSAEFRTTVGVRQGCLLLSILLNPFLVSLPLFWKWARGNVRPISTAKTSRWHPQQYNNQWRVPRRIQGIYSGYSSTWGSADTRCLQWKRAPLGAAIVAMAKLQRVRESNISFKTKLQQCESLC